MLHFRWLTALAFSLIVPISGAMALEDVRATFVRQAMAEAGVVGASVALIENHEITWTQGFGTVGPSGAPVTPLTEFEAASNGKMVASFVLMQLIDEGAFALDTPLVDIRLTIEEGCEAPTISQALAHTAGLGNALGAKRFSPACKPGETFAYAGQGYMVLQSMLETWSGRPVDELMQDRVFGPLAMSSARFAQEATEDFATGHTDLIFGLLSGRAPDQGLAFARGFALILAVLFLFICWRAFARLKPLVSIAITLAALPVFLGIFLVSLSLITTPVKRTVSEANLAFSLQLHALDLARFARELMAPTLLSDAARDRLFDDQVVVNEDISWAHGIGIDRSDGHTTWWHWGSNPGYQSLFVIEPDTGNAVVIMTNTGGFSDFVSRKRGGYTMAKRIARDLLEIDGAWDIRGYR